MQMHFRLAVLQVEQVNGTAPNVAKLVLSIAIDVTPVQQQEILEPECAFKRPVRATGKAWPIPNNLC